MGERAWNDEYPEYVKRQRNWWAKVWGKKRGIGRYHKRGWHRAERRYNKQVLRDPSSDVHRSPVHYESEVNWKGH